MEEKIVAPSKQIIPEEIILHKIFVIRGQKVLLGQYLAELYQVSPGVLIQAMKRNRSRFPEDFVFQLTAQEFQNLKSQFVISSWGGLRTTPYAFTEHGVAMLASILKSQRAIQMSIFIVRAFIKMRELFSTNKELAQKIGEIEKKQKEHGDQLSSVYSIVKQLINKPLNPDSQIGFREKR